MKNEISRFGLTSYEQKALSRRNVKEAKNTVLIILIVLALVALIGAVASMPRSTHADTAATPTDDFCARARIDAYALARDDHKKPDYGANLTKMCGSLN